ncbi:MAG: polyprenol monophosphomannose synthase [Endomicrobiales bacterium]
MEIMAMIPTYNEAGNIAQVIKEVLSLPLDVEVLVVDDFSPDGTYSVVEELARTEPRVHLLLRRENRGRGWAGIDGFRKALQMGARYVVEMDADLSHPPRYIPAFHKKAAESDIVIGSRYVSGGRDEARSLLRRSISAFARRYLAFVLGVQVADPTSGFRLFRREALDKILPHLRARDPFIVTEALYHARKHGLKVVEEPIEFMPRLSGESKLKAATLLKYFFRVWGLKITR